MKTASYRNFEKNLELLKKQIRWLEISIVDIVDAGIKDDFSIEEFGRFEIACSRFSRSINFLIRKVFRSIDDYEFVNQGSLVDVVNNAHKRALFDDIEELRLMKDLRNMIVHEYIEDELIQVFKDVYKFAPKLLTIMKRTAGYIEALT